MRSASLTRADLPEFNERVIQTQDQAYTLAYLFLADEQRASTLVQATVGELYGEMRRPFPSFPQAFMRCLVEKLVEEPVFLQKLEKPACLFAESFSPEWLASLPARCRLAVILVDCLGLDYASAAQVSGASLDQVRSALAQGRVQLARLIRAQAV